MSHSKINDKDIFDWQKSVALAASQADIAQAMLAKFELDLEQQLAMLKQLFEANNHADYLAMVHQLHGACCYLAVPRLKHSLLELETLLKKSEYETALSAFAKQHIAVIEEAELLVKFLRARSFD